MKRIIAILLVLLFCITGLVGCGRNDTNVSERTDGTIEDNDSPSVTDTIMPDKSDNEKVKEDKTSDEHTNDIKDSIDDVVDNTGDAVEEIGRDIGDAVTGHDRDNDTK